MRRLIPHHRDVVLAGLGRVEPVTLIAIADIVGPYIGLVETIDAADCGVAAAKHSRRDRAVLIVFRQTLLVVINRSVPRWAIGKVAVADLDRPVGPPVRHRFGYRHSPGEQHCTVRRYRWRRGPFRAGEVSVGPRIGAGSEPAFTAAANVWIDGVEFLSGCAGRNEPRPNQRCADHASPQQSDST